MANGDVYAGFGGNDVIYGTSRNETLYDWQTYLSDYLNGCCVMVGGAGNDNLWSGAGAEAMTKKLGVTLSYRTQ
jgi:Ca2+-binding RTX toxin-like protein